LSSTSASSDGLSGLLAEVCGEAASSSTHVREGRCGRGIFVDSDALQDAYAQKSQGDPMRELLRVPMESLLYVGTEPPYTHTHVQDDQGPAQTHHLRHALKSLMEGEEAHWSVKLAALLLWAIHPEAETCAEAVAKDKAKSCWSRYRAFLPELHEMTSLLCFQSESDACAALQDAQLAYEAGTYPATLDKWHRKFFAGGPLAELAASEADLLWALCILRTRSLTLTLPSDPPQQVMVLAPFVDMANHDSNGLGRIVFDARGIALCMLARTNPIGSDASQEVRFSYGDLDNQDLMRSFGFAVEGNEADAITIQADSEDERAVLTRVFECADMGAGAMSLTPCTPVVYRCSSSGRALSPWEAEFAGYGPDESYDGKSAAATGRARAKAARSLLKKIKARVDEFPTSEKQDREELELLSGSASPQMCAALRYRIARKVTWRIASENLDAYRVCAKNANVVGGQRGGLIGTGPSAYRLPAGIKLTSDDFAATDLEGDAQRTGWSEDALKAQLTMHRAEDGRIGHLRDRHQLVARLRVLINEDKNSTDV